MKKAIFLSLVISLWFTALHAQKNTDNKNKSFEEKLEQFGQDLIAQPEKAADPNADKLTNDNLSIGVHPLWREKGTYTIVQFNLNKTDLDPLKATMPLGDKKIIQSLTLNMGSTKKSAADKKSEVLNGIKKHLTAYYKDGGISKSSQELADALQGMIISTGPFTTTQGKSGEIVWYNDIETKQSSLIGLMVLTDAEKGLTYFVQINYIRFNYETNYPEDVLEWRAFLYPDEQQTYMDFTKKMFATFFVK